ncbi:MAG: MetQ/NlpA family ABC transporter substrate-binding protein [Candidatus Azobacteroides sp.]|nr:MetQ/NlpA family ABC transporter substrate-binding protein [Candidatus Azobacteroides sp.]
MKKYLAGILFLSLSLTLNGCMSKNKKDDTLIIGVMSSADLLPYSIAQQNGLFEKNGIKVKIQKFYSANDRDAALQTGNIDGSIIDLTGTILQKANGIDLQITSKEYGVFHILAGKNSGIQTLQELKNRKIASSKNTVIDFITDLALESVGINPSEIHRQEINKIPIRLEMLQNGQTDATGLPEPFISIALQNGATSLANIQDLGYNATCMVFRTSIISEKQQQIQAMYKAYNEAVEFIHSSTRAEYKNILTKDLSVPENLTERIFLPDYEFASLPTGKDINITTKWLKEKNLIPENFESDVLVNNQFIEP